MFCPSANLSVNSLKQTDLELNPSFHGNRPATNSQSHVKAGSGALQIRGHTEKNYRYVETLKSMSEIFYLFVSVLLRQNVWAERTAQ
jgi:hypothetical protein